MKEPVAANGITMAWEVQPPNAVLKIVGALDFTTSPAVRETLIDWVIEVTTTSSRTNLVVDLSGVEFIDQTGLGVLVGGLKRTRARELKMALIITSERILKIFNVTGLSMAFEIYPGLAAIGDETKRLTRESHLGSND